MAPPAAEAAPAAASPDLAELWQQILAGLELPSTRMLLSQQAHLHRLDNQRAVVRVAGNWIAMVQTRLPLLEKAMAQALGGARSITLEAGEQRETPAQSTAPAQAPPAPQDPAPPPEVALATSPAQARPQPSAPAAPPSAALPTAFAPEPNQPIAGVASGISQGAPQPSKAPATGNPVSTDNPVPTTASAAAPASRIDEQTKLFAEFFNGEVVADDET
ncbi:MAG: hypothetical protein ACKOE9_05525 [Vulcanococcus sp.]